MKHTRLVAEIFGADKLVRKYGLQDTFDADKLNYK